MRQRAIIPIGLFVAGIACIAAAVLSGEADVSLFLIFPVFSGSSGLFLLGTAMIVFSFVTGFLFLMMGQLELAGETVYTDTARATRGTPDGKPRYGGVVLIGPVPIAFGSDRAVALAMLVIGIVVAIAALIILAFVFA